MISLKYEKRHKEQVQIMDADSKALTQALFYIINFSMKAIFFVAIVVLAVAQFSLPDVLELGSKVGKELEKVEKKVEHLTTEQVQKVQEAVKEGIDYVTGKSAEQEKKHEESKEAKKVEEIVPEKKTIEGEPFIMIGGAPANLNENNNIEQVMEDKLELAQKNEQKAQEVQPEIKVDQTTPLPEIPEKPQVETQENKSEEERDSENSTDLSEEQSGRPRHGKHRRGRHGKHGKSKEQYTPEELKKRLQERQQKHRRKTEWRKDHAKRYSQKESRGPQREHNHQAKPRFEDRSASYRKHSKSSDISLPGAPEPQHVQILAKLKVKSP